MRLIFWLVLIVLTIIGCSRNENPKLGAISSERLLNHSSEPGSWLTTGRDYQQSYYSPLEEINQNNVNSLGFAWQYAIDSTAGFEATPIVVDGLMFSSGPKGSVYAIDAKTGKERWTFDPGKVDPVVLTQLSSGTLVNRGVSVWNGRVYVASIDGYLYALDADTGAVLWKVDTLIERGRGYSITGATYIANNVVVIGNSGAEFGVRGYVTAYDLNSGDLAWRFFTVPGDPTKGFEHPEMKMAAKTWSPESLWETGLGGTVWDGMAYDPVLNLLFVGTGNAGPYPREIRSPGGGDNLFLSSILAINPDSGRLVWHYQTTPGDMWDYTATQKMILADLKIKGQIRQVIMQAPKNGFFYVLDRVTGELLSAEPYVQVNWASHIDKDTGRPVETGQGDYSRSPKMVFPAPGGGHNWQPMAYNPNTGLVYIPVIEQPAIFNVPHKNYRYQKGAVNRAVDYYYPVPGKYGLDSELAKQLPIEQLAKGQADYTIRGFLRAWDPIKQQKIWEVETSGQWAGDVFATWNGGGVMTSAGNLVFQGRGTGELVALNATTGKELHKVNVGTSMMAAPMTYTIEGEQYIAIMAGVGGVKGTSPPPGSAAYKYGNKGRIVAFKLKGGNVPLPIPKSVNEHQVFQPPLPRRDNEQHIRSGGVLFQRNCAICHKNTQGSGIPDLRKMTEQTHSEFKDIVLNGIRANRGMGSFEGRLSEAEVESIQAYLIDLAWNHYEDTQMPVVH